MTWALFAVGVVLLLFVAFDFVATTLSVTVVRGSIAAAVTDVVHRSVRRLSPRWRLATGPGAMIAVLLAWTLLSMLGWAAVLVVPLDLPSSGTAAAERLRGSLAVLSSGATDEVGVLPLPWEVVLQVARLYGLALLSLALAWVLPVISAVVERRTIAVRVALLGSEVDELVGRHDHGTTDLHLYLQSLAEALVRVVEQHRAYPVLHGFRTRHPDRSFGVAVARLDRACHQLREREAIDRVTLAVLDRAVGHVVRVFEGFVDVTPDGAAGDGQVGADRHRDAERDREHREAVLRRIVVEEGWSWDEVGAGSAPAHR